MKDKKRKPDQQGGASQRDQQAQQDKDRQAQRNNPGNPARPGEQAPRRSPQQGDDLDEGEQQRGRDERRDQQR
jgi:hypothetical protein